MERTPIARSSARVERLLRENAGEHAGVLAAPLTLLLGDRSYFRELAKQLESVARDRAVHWPARRVAALMFETLLSRIPAADVRERRFWLRRLGMTDPVELARQGYVRGEALETQVWRRLARLTRIHRLTLVHRISDRALQDFLCAARAECRLTFARFLFPPEEVIARIEHDVRRSTGLGDPNHHGRFRDEAARTIANLPHLERTLVEHLAHRSVIRWAASSTTSRINSLVEQPVGTVVLTVKPPGSTHELEIKRAGLVRDLPLAVVWARNNYIVPSSHHLDGGSMHQLLTYEAENSSFFSYVFRTIHGVDASMSRTLHLATVQAVATPRGEVNLLDYFTDPAVFGDNYEVMRWHMYQVVKTLTGYDKEPWEEPLNDVALTGNFIGRVKPAQAIQIGTTSFRLERLEKYLSPSGADRYFRQGLGLARYTPDDARRFADELLDEILGQYEPPRVAWRSHAQYVEAAFRVPANRAAAAASYLSVLEQLGRFWGTLLGLRGHTQGESFVERNAGLRSVWRDGRWQVELVFMDHDSLSFASVGTHVYRPRDSVANAAKDAKHVLGGVYGKSFRVRGEHWFLRHIYRVGSALERRGVAAFRAEMKRAYDRTHDAIRTNPELSKLFHESFLANLRDWDELVTGYFQTPKLRSARNAWRAASHAHLVARGYDKDIAEEHVKTVTIQAKFLRRIGFLF
ncbi:MAG TPA: hypothetical protein VGF28_11630 [Thermoanaerobaculia bacterium]|jgi:hypothetical protein